MTDKEYMPAPRDGKPLVSIDRGLLVTTPEGLDVGYVSIVTRQRDNKNKFCSTHEPEVLCISKGKLNCSNFFMK